MTTDRETRRRVRLGLVGLLSSVIIGLLAPMIGGLNGSTHGYEHVRLEPGASLPLSAGSEVTLDSGDGATLIGGCSIVGPGTWSHQIVAAGRMTDFRTGPDGAYKITCWGGAVEVENNAGARTAADPQDDRRHRVTVAMLTVAGLIGVASVGVLIASGRTGDRPRADEVEPSRTEAEGEDRRG